MAIVLIIAIIIISFIQNLLLEPEKIKKIFKKKES